MTTRILITGSSGLVGSALAPKLEALGWEVVRFDIEAPRVGDRHDVRDEKAVFDAVESCDGIVHMAAVSRVKWGQDEPDLCVATNVGGTRNVVEAAKSAEATPWILFTSSREVYGEAEDLPVAENASLRPMNIYARSKVTGEELMATARSEGLSTAVVRLSNVYGSTDDYADRVVPAFARAAVLEERLRVDGADHTFDFTHIDDTVRGLLRIIDRLEQGRRELAPMHLLTGQPTTLGELAELAVHIAGTDAPIIEAPPRSYDVCHFFGDPRKTEQLLDWSARIPIEEGLHRLISDFRNENLMSTEVLESS